MQILKIIFILLEVIILFNLIIIVHELGHFLAARWRGLVVERFGIWFGRPLWKKEINGVIYCLGSIPAGGYVALPQMAPMETIEGKSERQGELPPVSALDKIIVAFAGPLFSFMLAIVFAGVIWFVGRPVSESETTTVVGYVVKDSPADKVGIKPGDRILSVDGYPVGRFLGMGDDSISWRIVRSEGDRIPIKIERDGQILEVFPSPTKDQTKGWERRGLRQIKIAPKQTPMVAKVAPHGPADRAGLKPNDIIISANGVPLFAPEGLAEVIEENLTNTIQLTVRRDESTFEAQVKPELPMGEKQPRIGIYWDMMGKMTLIHPGPIEQVRASVNSMVNTLGALFSPKSDIKAQHLSGPVGIMRMYYLLFKSEQGWRLALWFSVVLNVNLALLNLLPIPVLDGGHITLAVAEAIRRKPINVRLLNAVQTACAMLIIGYMLYVTFYDVQDLPWRRKARRDLEMRFTPAPSQPSQPEPAAPAK